MEQLLTFDFSPRKTTIFVNSQERRLNPEYERFTTNLKALVSVNTLQKIFGFTSTTTIALLELPLYQITPCFSDALPGTLRPEMQCLVVCGLDQDPYFRLARDLAATLGLPKPAVLASGYLPPLTGVGEKMSSSVAADSTIFLSDCGAELAMKIKK